MISYEFLFWFLFIFFSNLSFFLINFDFITSYVIFYFYLYFNWSFFRTYTILLIHIFQFILVNPLTPRCAEFSRWLQCRTIYRKNLKKDRKLHILPFLGSLFRMAQSEFSKNDAKPFSFPKIHKKTLFLG